jgi:hypothetical protein
MQEENEADAMRRITIILMKMEFKKYFNKIIIIHWKATRLTTIFLTNSKTYGRHA